MTEELFDDMPNWLDGELWREFVTNRVRLKKPMTDIAQKRMLIKLKRFHEKAIDVNECLERSLINGWKDIYEPDRRRQREGSASEYVNELVDRGVRLDIPTQAEQRAEQQRKRRVARPGGELADGVQEGGPEGPCPGVG